MSFEAWLERARILAVEDDPAAGILLGKLLARDGYRDVHVEQDPNRVIEEFDRFRPDLVLLDFHMPDWDGFELLQALKSRTDGESCLPFLIMTGDPRAEVKERALVLGASDFLAKPFQVVEVKYRIRNLLRTRYLCLQFRAQRDQLEVKVRERTEEVERAQMEIVERLALASDYRDFDTGHHTRRVGDISARIAERLGLPAGEAALIGHAAQLHDIGKIGVPDAVLTSRARLTPEEYEVMKTHATIGAEILSGGHSQLLTIARQIALHHHEHWDGTGYPQGLRGEEIPLSARIVAVADFYDALTHDRRYRSARPVSEVLAMIRAAAGSHFDAAVVEAFLGIHAALADAERPASGEPAAVG